MSLAALGSLLEAVPQYKQLSRLLRETRANARVQVVEDAVPFLLSTLWQHLGAPMLVIAPRPEEARRLYEQMAVWAGADAQVLHFPETETLPFERLVSDTHTVHERLRTLSNLAETRDESVAPIVVASATAVAQKTLTRDHFSLGRHTLRTNDEIDLNDLLDLWRKIGYRFGPVAEAPGDVSRRGGILDIFPVAASSPVRIELWGDQIDSIRRFDPATQLSTDVIDSVTVIPAAETLPALSSRDELDRRLSSMEVSNCTGATKERLTEEFNTLLDGLDVEELEFYSGLFNHGSLLNYFSEDAVLVRSKPSDVVAAAWDADERAHELREIKEGRGELPRNFPSSHLLWSEVEMMLDRFPRRLDITPWGADDLAHRDVFVLPFSSAPRFLGRLDKFAEEAQELAAEAHRVVAVTSLPKRLGEILEERGVHAELIQSLSGPPGPGSITIVQSSGAGLSEGFSLTADDHKLVLFGDSEIFGVAKQRRTTRRRSARREALLTELRPGDFVVHVEHGIAKFAGTGTSPSDQSEREYLILQYAAGDKLYVPMEHLDRLTPYVAPMDRAPTLTRLGSQEWTRTKERVARSTREMASELLTLYATREAVEGIAFGPDTPWQVELEDSFPYEETPDQLETMAEVRADMERSRPMDRLVCGDVGYGKTEIALRAAFKAVMDGKQVAVLVPTTVLAQQHYATFSQRLSAYPIKVEVLSRFRTDYEQRQVLEGLANGTVDICIGTHRLVQKDVTFAKLALVIVDEEQRFGVAHKERLKQMRSEVDVLTLTATPIPRTLHMSLAGIRDMSMIETPPEERLPIKTYVSEFSDELIREAILRELDRQGQVYFLHNRVHSIDYMAGYIRRLVPEAEVGVAHGQMPESRLEETMLAFSEGKMDVLVCTTIIESGLDIPNVNTLIVDRADTFGLSQLYQLRGRVGRGARRAYSYLLIPKARSLTETAEKRLKTMLAATELGAGFRIAMKDLEIRGAGNILGSQQSGHIHAVGFDLYTRMLEQAVEDVRARGVASQNGTGTDSVPAIGPELEAGEEQPGVDPISNVLGPSREVAPSVDLGMPAGIPDEFISDLSTRLDIYQRMIKLESDEGIDAMEAELVDRFGPPPWQVQNLLFVTRLKLRAQEAGIKSISKDDENIVLRLRDQVGGARTAVQRVLGQGAQVGNSRIRLDLGRHGYDWEAALMATVTKLADFKKGLTAALA